MEMATTSCSLGSAHDHAWLEFTDEAIQYRSICMGRSVTSLAAYEQNGEWIDPLWVWRRARGALPDYAQKEYPRMPAMGTDALRFTF